MSNKKTFDCIKCGKSFNFKSDYDRHVNRKISCDDNERDMQILKKKTCIHCNIVLTRVDSMAKHLKTCKEKQIKIDKDKIENNQNDKNKDDILASLLQEMNTMKTQQQQSNDLIQRLQHEIITLKSSKKVSVKGNLVEGNMNNTQNTVNNIHNEIKIIAYGKEDLSFISDDNYRLLLNKGFKSVQNLVEYIHLNQNKPENQNIYISNMRDNYILIYDGNQWQLKEREDVLQEMIENKTDILNEKFDELIKTLDESTIKKFKRFLDEKDEDRVVDQIKKELKLILYNKKPIKELPARIGGNNSIKQETTDNDSSDDQKSEKETKTTDMTIHDHPKLPEKEIHEPKIEEQTEKIIKTYRQRKSVKV